MRIFEKDLRAKITAILILLVLLASGAALAVSYGLVNRIVRDNIEDAMLDSSRMTASLLEVALERRQSRMSLLSGDSTLRDPAADATARGRVLDAFIASWPIGKGAVLLDTAGNVRFTTEGVAASGNVSDTSWFETAQLARVAFTYINDPGELKALGYSRPVLAASVPVRDANGQIFAYVAAFTTLDDIRKAIGGASIGGTGHAFLVKSDGRMVAGKIFPDDAPGNGGDEERKEKLVETITAGASGRDSVRYGGRLYMVTYSPLLQPGVARPELDLSVGIVMPHDEAYGPAHMVAWSLVGLAAVLLVVAIVVSIVLGRSITRPIIELAASAERIGSGDLTCEVAIRTRDQTGTLAAAFLRMRDYLRSAIGEAARSSDRMSALAEEQSAATRDAFSGIEDTVDSVVALARNLELQSGKIEEIAALARGMPPEALASPGFENARKLLDESEALAAAGAARAVEIATTSQDMRAAVRDVAAAARRLSEMAAELRELVSRFKT